MVSRKHVVCQAIGAIVAALTLTCQAQSASADWTPFVIRDSAGQIGANLGTGTGVEPTYALVSGTLTVQIPLSGQKVGYGTTDFNGQLLSSVGSMTYTPVDPGPGLTPYTNVWITDGTHYAAVTPYNATTVDTEVLGQSWSGLNVKIAETDYTTAGGLDWLFTGAKVNNTGSRILQDASGNNLTFADLASGLTIGSPDFSTYTLAGTGAARNGDGINLIFGDTSGNYDSAVPYVVSGVSVASAVPEPASLSLLALGGIALLARRRKA